SDLVEQPLEGVAVHARILEDRVGGLGLGRDLVGHGHGLLDLGIERRGLGLLDLRATPVGDRALGRLFIALGGDWILPAIARTQEEHAPKHGGRDQRLHGRSSVGHGAPFLPGPGLPGCFAAFSAAFSSRISSRFSSFSSSFSWRSSSLSALCAWWAVLALAHSALARACRSLALDSIVSWRSWPARVTSLPSSRSCLRFSISFLRCSRCCLPCAALLASSASL